MLLYWNVYAYYIYLSSTVCPSGEMSIPTIIELLQYHHHHQQDNILFQDDYDYIITITARHVQNRLVTLSVYSMWVYARPFFITTTF